MHFAAALDESEWCVSSISCQSRRLAIAAFDVLQRFNGHFRSLMSIGCSNYSATVPLNRGVSIGNSWQFKKFLPNIA
jgi:hypothetical protein